MIRSYTPEERAERRRRSSERFISNAALVSAADIEDSDSEASWIADLRSQGVNVDDFLKAASPPEIVEIPEDRSFKERPARRMSKAQHDTIINKISSKPDVNENAKKRFTQFMDKSYVFDETVGDMVIHSLEEMTQKRWEAEVEQDSKNYDPSGTSAEKLNLNKKWALETAMRRVAESGYMKPAQNTTQNGDSTEKHIYPKVAPPKTEPLPPIDEKDFETSEQSLNHQELGIFPPRLPYKLADLVPKAARSQVGIPDGIAMDGTYEEGLESCGPDALIVSCINDQCMSYIQCPREASLVRCEKCNTVTPVCPELSDSQGGNLGGDVSLASSFMSGPSVSRRRSSLLSLQDSDQAVVLGYSGNGNRSNRLSM